MLEKQGFVRLDAGALSVRDQIDHFAAADTIVGLHGAALSNLVFAPPGVRVLELFAPNYIKPMFWSIVENIPGSRYNYLVAGGPDQHGRGRPMNGIRSDIDLDVAQVSAALDRLLDS